MNPLQRVEQNLIQAGHQSFYGGFAQQNPAAFLSFNRLLNAHNFDTIIEIGSHDFGLSTMFALYVLQSKNPARCSNPNEPVLYKNTTHHKRPKNFLTFDYVLRDEAGASIVRHLGGQFIQGDVLNDQTMIQSIRSITGDSRAGTVLLLCDGGNKKKELDLYGSALKKGDFVMLHDWAKDEATFEHNKAEGIWHCWESRLENGPDPIRDQFGIKELLDRDGIQQVYGEEFDRVAWFCGQKI